jgi:hypothetical protein
VSRARGVIEVRRGHPLHSAPRRPKTHATYDVELARRDQLQQALLCGAFHRDIPGVPLACAPPPTVISFDDEPADAAISTQYTARGVTFGPMSSVDSRPPEIVDVGNRAISGVRVLRLGRCFSPNCEFGTQFQLSGTFAVPQRGLGMFIGPFTATTAATATLKAFDAQNRLVGQTQITLAPGAGFHTPLTFNAGSAAITRFVVSVPNPVGVDDFAFA